MLQLREWMPNGYVMNDWIAYLISLQGSELSDDIEWMSDCVKVHEWGLGLRSDIAVIHCSSKWYRGTKIERDGEIQWNREEGA